MSEKIDFVEKSTSFILITKASESEIVINDQYRKINKKNEIKFIKLNSDNYQNWTNDMKILLSIKMMWFLIFKTAAMFDSLKFFDRMKWLIDDVQTKTWIYVNLKNSQHNHIKKLIIAHAMWKTLKKVHDAFDQKKLNFLKKNSSIIKQKQRNQLMTCAAICFDCKWLFAISDQRRYQLIWISHSFWSIWLTTRHTSWSNIIWKIWRIWRWFTSKNDWNWWNRK